MLTNRTGIGWVVAWTVAVYLAAGVGATRVAATEQAGPGTEDPVYFADPRLKAIVEEEMDISNPTPADMLSLTSLWALGERISDLTGIEYAHNLSDLELWDNNISDISPLANLTNLTELDLCENNVSDLSPLADLTNLTELYLCENKVSDISPLAHLTNLTELELSFNKVSDLSSLADLTNLTRLYLYGNEVQDISALAQLTTLAELELADNKVRDISILAQLTSLTRLDLSWNEISDVAALTRLTRLASLDLSFNEIGDVSALARLTTLTELDLGANEISDISPLANLTNLTELHLHGNDISDISALARLTMVARLSLGANEISDISPLGNLTNLTYLYLSSNDVSDISALAQATKLTTLNLRYNEISDISALAQLTELGTLDLGSNEISDISALAQLTNLIEVDLKDNALSMFTHCVVLPKIRSNNPYAYIRHDPTPAGHRCDRYGIYYVDARATQGNDGSSWTTAFPYLQDALAAATYGSEIRAAQGVYTPDRGVGVQRGDRYASFQLKNGVALKGGYAGASAAGRGADPNTRDTSRFETVLSGDLAGDDQGNWSHPSRADNSLHVVSAENADSTAVLDGFTVRAGNASAGSPFKYEDECGGGMIARDAARSSYDHPTVMHCVFRDNYADFAGGGLKCDWVTLVDCEFVGNHAGSFGGGMDVFGGNLQGCSFRNNSAGWAGGGVDGTDGLKLTDCVFTENSAPYAGALILQGFLRLDELDDELNRDFVTVDNLTLGPNSAEPDEAEAGYFEDIPIRLDGDLNLDFGRLDLVWTLFDGPGTLNLGEEALLRVARGGFRSTVIRANIAGPGDIEIDTGEQLIIEGDSIVNLSDVTDGIPDPERGGHIRVEGSLVVRGNATLEGSNVTVKLLDVNTPNDIQYNNITLQEASTGFGGEFFVSGNARVRHNHIVSEGDRYLDLDPDPLSGENPTLSDNHIEVIIKEGTLSNQGTLLELRARDYDCGRLDSSNPDCASGAYPASAESEGFTDDPSENWVLDKLSLQPNAKLNLTNRQGFEFQDLNDCCPGSWETVYVKELVMGPNSVLNTGLQTLYYQTLVDPEGEELVRSDDDPFAPLANGARFVDIPVLGFSLGIIAMNDPAPSPHNEFDSRVRKRLIDPEDEQADSSDPMNMGLIERIDDDPGIPIGCGGVMEMRTQAPDKESARSIAAKGAFARAGDEDITVEFEYRFMEDPYGEAEIVVYLSGDPEVGRNLVPVAVIFPPAPGRSGSIGSDEFALFSGTFPRGDLNFTRGTYVELELQGRGARCWIDNWDPRVSCTAICGNFDGDRLGINIYDYLVLVAELGLSRPAGSGRGCLDLITDGNLNTDDLRAWEIQEVLHRCPRESDALVSLPSSPTPDSILRQALRGEIAAPLCLVGKPTTGSGLEVPQSVAYGLDVNEDTVEIDSLGLGPVSDGRLVSDSEGHIYQVDGHLGLVQLETAEAVVQPMEIRDGDTTILVGAFRDYDHDGDKEGFLLLDCVFDPQDPSIVYVLPVLVDEGYGPYMAAAKLQLAGSGTYDVLQLYGADPTSDPCQTIALLDTTGTIVYEPDYQHLVEIEIDREGKYLFVLNRHTLNNNTRVLIYDTGDGSQPAAVCDVNLAAPTAMVVSSVEDTLYLASSRESDDDPVPNVHCFSVDTAGPDKGLIYEGCISITYPQPDVDLGLGSIAAITSMTENRADGTLYVAGFTAPKLPDDEPIKRTLDQVFPGLPEIFTTPVFVTIPLDSTSVEAKAVGSADPSLALPLSVAWVGAAD